MIFAISLASIHAILTINIMPGYRANFKYEGMLAHSFDRCYVVTKFEIKDLKLTTFTFDFACRHLMSDKTFFAKILKALPKNSALCKIVSGTSTIL